MSGLKRPLHIVLDMTLAAVTQVVSAAREKDGLSTESQPFLHPELGGCQPGKLRRSSCEGRGNQDSVML